jgi:chromosome segregation ATPase
MFGFKKESVFDTRLVGVDESNCPITGMPSRYWLTLKWVDGQLSKGREAVKIAGMVMDEAGKFAERMGSLAGKRDAEVAAANAENAELRAENAALRDALDQACKDNEAIEAELDELYDDAAVLCDLLDEADGQAGFYEDVITAMRGSVQPQAAKKGKKGAGK